MLVFDHTWSSAATTGGQTPVVMNGQDANSWRVFARASTGSVTTAAIQIAESSAGPWVSVVSTSVSTTAPSVMDFVGPLFGQVRAYSGSTGATIRLVGVD